MAKMPEANEVERTPAGQHDWPSIIGGWSPEERREKERKFVRKIDLHLLPILVCSLLIFRQLEIVPLMCLYSY